MLMQGTGDAKLFMDVAFINRALEQPEKTRDLFHSITETNRSLAEKCFRVALESLTRTKDFSLARSFLTEPRKEIDQAAAVLKFSLERVSSVDPEMLQEALAAAYVVRVAPIFAVFAGVGEEGEAHRLREYAMERVPFPQLRDRVAKRLYPLPPSTRIQ